MPRYTVVANVFDRDGNETQNKMFPVDATNREAALVQAAETLGQRYEQFTIKEVRGADSNPVAVCKAALRQDPDWAKPETMKALAVYFRATGQDWLCTPSELRA